MRVQVNLSDELVERIDNYAKQFGLSRSALCSVFIGQGVMSYDKGIELAERFADETIKKAAEVTNKN